MWGLILPVHNHRLHSEGDLKVCVVVYSPRRDGIVVDLNQRRSPIPSGGTEIKLKPFFRNASFNLVNEKLEDLVERYKYDAEDADCIDQVPSSRDVGDDPTK